MIRQMEGTARELPRASLWSCRQPTRMSEVICRSRASQCLDFNGPAVLDHSTPGPGVYRAPVRYGGVRPEA